MKPNGRLQQNVRLSEGLGVSAVTLKKFTCFMCHSYLKLTASCSWRGEIEYLVDGGSRWTKSRLLPIKIQLPQCLVYPG